MELVHQKETRYDERSWCMIYSFDANFLMEELELSEESCGKFYIDFNFYSKLRKLEKVAIVLQYQIAYLSTMGGAYHLCNRPNVAYQIAVRQESVGRYLGSSHIIVRALVFQAVNLRLLGYPNKSQLLFHKIRSIQSLPEDLLNFVDASDLWLTRNADLISTRHS
jgi:hypothetical protein